MDPNYLVPGDTILVEHIVSYLKAKGIFDEFRHDCLADVDTKSSCQNLSQRVDGYTTKFLSNVKWSPDLNKNELRNKLRRHIDESGMLAVGADHVVEQVINPKVNQLFLPRIIEVVHQYLKEENEKITKKNELELEASKNKATEYLERMKNTSIDPIADILSFTYSKPKSSNQTKSLESSKQEKKKDENVIQSKVSENSLKIERTKKDENAPQSKFSEIIPKIEKKKDDKEFDGFKIKKEESVPIVKNSEIMPKTEKKKDDKDLDSFIIKKETIVCSNSGETATSVDLEKEEFADLSSEIPNDIVSTQSFFQIIDAKESTKIKSELKSELIEEELNFEEKLESSIKPEKKKYEDLKLSASDSSTSNSKSSTHSKPKYDSDKAKKIKTHKSSSSSTEHSKVKSKETFSSPSKSSNDNKHKVSSSKHLKSSETPGTSYKSIKTYKPDGKAKSLDGHSKTSKSTEKKSSSSKHSLPSKDASFKGMTFGEKSEKHQVHKHSKHSDGSSRSQSEKEIKSSNLQYSSSYDSSQGSDQDKSSSSSVSFQEKSKHFSKHLKKESSHHKTKDKSSDKKHHQSDSETPKKHTIDTLSSKYLEKQREISSQEAAKISSRSNSASSMSDSPSSSKDNISEDTSDNSSKFQERKKKVAGKDKEHCHVLPNLPPPPPPPPPPSSMIHGTPPSSMDLSSMDETQSSQNSGSESEVEEDSSSASESDLIDSPTKSTHENEATFSNDINDLLLFSSSSSEFEGFSSPEKKVRLPRARSSSDLSVSSVNTSDLSSFEDEVTDSDSECEEGKKFSLKEAEALLKAKKNQHSSTIKKTVSSEVILKEDQASTISLEISTPVAISEEDKSPPPEPKRESRRERKLNPKYASEEYTSIFNSKRTSFITKMNEKTGNTESEAVAQGKTPPKKSRCSSEKAELQNVSGTSKQNMEPAVTYTITSQTIFSPDDKLYSKNHDKNFNSYADSDVSNRIALKIKISATKNDNQTNKVPFSYPVKRKLEVNDRPTPAKKMNHCGSAVYNENKPFNSKANHSSVDVAVEQKVFHKTNNGDVLNKKEFVIKTSLPNVNHVTEQKKDD